LEELDVVVETRNEDAVNAARLLPGVADGARGLPEITGGQVRLRINDTASGVA
jgi:hypothetical protein